MSPIETYLKELSQRLSKRLPQDKLAEVLQETEAHLRSCAEEHGEEGAIIRYGRVESVVHQILSAQTGAERTTLATVLIIVSPIVIAMLSLVPSFAR